MLTITRKDIPCLLTVFVVALTVRLVYFTHQQDNPFFQLPIADSAAYMLAAEKLLESGDWLGKTVFTYGGGAFYIFYLALFFKFFGTTIPALLLVQLAAGALSCAIIALLGCRLYNRPTGLLLGLWAGFLAPFIFHEGLLLTSSFTIFFLTISLLLLLGSHPSAPTGKTLFSTGLFFGLAVLCRPNLLLLAPCYLLAIPADGLRKYLTNPGPYLFLLGVVLIILPVTIRNYIVTNDFVLISSGGGWNFYLGNNPEAPGFFSVPQKSGVVNDYTIYESAHQVAERRLGRSLTPSEGSRYWFRQGLDFTKEHPGEAALLMGKKFTLFWNNQEVTNIYDFKYFQKYSPLLAIPLFSFGMLAVVGLTGSAFILLRGSPREKLLVLFGAGYMGSVLLFFVSSRLREPMAVFLLLASGFLIHNFTAISRRTASILLIVFVLAASLVLLPLPDDCRKLNESFSHTYFTLGKKLLKDHQYQQAFDLFAAALETDRENIMIMVEAGKAATESGNLPTAIAYYQQVLPYQKYLPEKVVITGRFSWPDPRQIAIYEADLELGRIFLEQGDYIQAESHLIAAAHRYSVGLEPHKYLAFVFEKLGKRQDAIRACRNYLKLFPNDPEMQHFLEDLEQSQAKTGD